MNLLAWCKKYLISFLLTQLVITLVSLPILISWGLGFSVMSFMGNLFFAPVLTIFLIISTLLLFTQLCGVPNEILVYALNTISGCWDYILHQGTALWVIACAKPPIIVLIGIFVLAFYLLETKHITSHIKRFLIIGGLILVCCGICFIQQYHNRHANVVMRFDQKLYAIKLVNSSSLILVDQGFFAQKKSVDKVVNYELKQWITKHYGNITIQEIHLTHPSMGSFNAALCICRQWHVQTVFLPYFSKELCKGAWRSYFKMREFLKEKGIRFVRYKDKICRAEKHINRITQ